VFRRERVVVVQEAEIRAARVIESRVGGNRRATDASASSSSGRPIDRMMMLTLGSDMA